MQTAINQEVYINSHITKVIKDRFDYSLRSVGRKSPTGVIIEGPTGVGKTTTCEREMMSINQQAESQGLPAPVYMIKSPNKPDTKEYYSEILAALGDHNPFIGTQQSLRERLYKQLELKKVKVLIFDEFQQLIEKRSDKVVRHTLDDIKLISDKFNIACIFVGTYGVSKLAENNEQAASRYPHLIRINYMGFKKNKQAITRKFMTGFFEAHALNTSAFDEYELCLRLFAATNGDLRLFVNLLDDATGFLTARENVKPITLKALAKSYQFLVPQVRKTKVNPFTASIEAIEIELDVENYSMSKKDSA